MTTTGTEGYADEAERFSAYAESIAFEDVHRHWRHLLPPAPARVLDIGAGTGRDAAAFAAMGHAVVAAEPTAELRGYGEQTHRAAAIEWVDDRLPHLSRLADRTGAFDVITMSAVWMHLDAVQRALAMPVVASLLASGGVVAMSLRHGPVPEGRVMYDVQAPETIRLARQSGLVLALERLNQPSTYSRKDVTWDWLAFRKAE
jgi:SAM-dependent methyltransferase